MTDALRPQEAAPAKINLALHVTGRRDDGYHLLDTLVVHGVRADRVVLVAEAPAAAPAFRLTIGGPFGNGLVADPDNLVLKAARLIADEALRLGRRPGAVDLHLDKHLPIASGLGGGSSDAAATLRLLDHAWRLDLGRERLAELAGPLGADLPMCVDGRPLRARGIGEAIEPVAGLGEIAMVLVNPGVTVSTPAVFRALRSRQNPPLPPLPERFADAAALAGWLGGTRNDLEAAAIGEAPVIAEVTARLARDPGCRLARMSGSGATCFGLFDDLAAAGAAAVRIAADHTGWWVAAGTCGRREGVVNRN